LFGRAAHAKASGAHRWSRIDMAAPTFCSGLADIASRYQGFIVDQWGVLHDGAAAYPEALDCLSELRAAGKKVVLLSNSGRRAAFSREHLAGMGIGPDLYDGLVTSGEATFCAIAARREPGFENLGRRCYLWSRHGDRGQIEGQDLQVVDSVAEADFLLLAGIADDARLEDFTAILDEAAARGLPMVCANPDITVVQPGGVLGMAPGAVARHYENLGAPVAYVGKPHHPIYQLCLETLAPLPPDAILAVGDSVAHDIAGGAAMGLATALIMGGIHAPLFDLERGPSANSAALQRLEADHGASPDWVLPRFRWRGL
jgi:HAD superfamily hydrolase (TIGR01459 family)